MSAAAVYESDVPTGATLATLLSRIAAMPPMAASIDAMICSAPAINPDAASCRAAIGGAAGVDTGPVVAALADRAIKANATIAKTTPPALRRIYQYCSLSIRPLCAVAAFFVNNYLE